MEGRGKWLYFWLILYSWKHDGSEARYPCGTNLTDQADSYIKWRVIDFSVSEPTSARSTGSSWLSV